MNSITYTTNSGHTVELPVIMDVSVVVPFDLTVADAGLSWVPEAATANIAVPGRVVSGYFVPLDVFRNITGQGWGPPAVAAKTPGEKARVKTRAAAWFAGRGVKSMWLRFLEWFVYAGPRRLTLWFYAIATTLLAVFAMGLCFYASVVVVIGSVTTDDLWQVAEGLGMTGLAWLLFNRIYRVEIYNNRAGRATAFIDCPPVPAINTSGVFAVIFALVIAYLTG